MNKTENCMVCGKTLIYCDKSETLRCIYCKTVEDGHIHCPEGHYICDRCHNRDAMAGIEETILSSESQDPFTIAELAMSLPGLTMLGCQHAYIAGGALMAAIRNRGKNGVGHPEIREVFKRTRKQAHGGYCGLTGVCGIAPAIGACFAVLTGSKCGKDEEQRITMEAVTKVSRAITDLTGLNCLMAGSYRHTKRRMTRGFIEEYRPLLENLSEKEKIIPESRAPRGRVAPHR